VVVSGKPGLFKVIGQSKAGFILQSLEEISSRIVVNANARLAALDETTVYGVDEDIPLKHILLKMQEAAVSKAVPDSKADGPVLRSYFTALVPEHDSDRVYSSDIKKIISWFHLLEKLPLFTEEDPKDVKEETASEKAVESTPTESPVQPATVEVAEGSGEKKKKGPSKETDDQIGQDKKGVQLAAEAKTDGLKEEGTTSTAAKAKLNEKRKGDK